MKTDPITVRYLQTFATHSTHFVVSASDEQLVLDCSSGLISENEGEVLPIHTRLALPWSAVERLADLLQQARARHAAHQSAVQSDYRPTARSNSDDAPAPRRASLPKLENSHA